MASKAMSFRSDLLMNDAGYNRNDLRSLSRQFKIQVQYTDHVQITIDFQEGRTGGSLAQLTNGKYLRITDQV